jgi:hypothetical protein
MNRAPRCQTDKCKTGFQSCFYSFLFFRDITDDVKTRVKEAETEEVVDTHTHKYLDDNTPSVMSCARVIGFVLLPVASGRLRQVFSLQSFKR